VKDDREILERIGTEAALEAGDLLKSRFQTALTVTRKGDINLVTEVDLAAEALIVEKLSRVFPEHTILAEENHSETQAGEFTWIIDPLDGTTNFAHGFPWFSVSIGLEIRGDLIWGIVYHPILGEIFTARRGGGAWLGRTPLRVSGTVSLSDSLLATGFPYDIRTSPLNNLDHFREFALRARAIRRAGSAALDLSYVAAGRFDGFWELKLNPWDCAAGYLLVREAGGMVTDFTGVEGTIYDRRCLASNGRIHEEMLQVLAAGSGRFSECGRGRRVRA